MRRMHFRVNKMIKLEQTSFFAFWISVNRFVFSLCTSINIRRSSYCVFFLSNFCFFILRISIVTIECKHSFYFPTSLLSVFFSFTIFIILSQATLLLSNLNKFSTSLIHTPNHMKYTLKYSSIFDSFAVLVIVGSCYTSIHLYMIFNDIRNYL